MRQGQMFLQTKLLGELVIDVDFILYFNVHNIT